VARYIKSPALSMLVSVYTFLPLVQKEKVRERGMGTVWRVFENSEKAVFMSVDVSRKSVSKVFCNQLSCVSSSCGVRAVPKSLEPTDV
jgi:hypothetical protein